MRFPDTPRRVSTDFLAQLDRDPPGMWLASAKIDGRRRMIYKANGVYTWHAKNRNDSAPVPAELRAQFEALPWPDGVGLDCEWSGPRHKDGRDQLWIFDLLMLGGVWSADTAKTRRSQLYELINPHVQCFEQDGGTTWAQFMRAIDVHLLPQLRFPFVDRFAEQVTNPLSEGLVVQRADYVMVGAHDKCHEAKSGYYKIKHRNIKEVGK